MQQDMSENKNEDHKAVQETQKNSVESIVKNSVIIVAIMLFWYINPQAVWPPFVALFAGVLPLSKTIVRIFRNRSSLPKKITKTPLELKANQEKEILRIAQKRSGVLTPSLVALDSELTIAEAEELLDSLATRSHCHMNIRPDGKIEYEFLDFKPTLT